MSKSKGHHGSGGPLKTKRHRAILAAIALVLVVAWLAWNALLVESDVATVGDAASEQAPAR